MKKLKTFLQDLIKVSKITKTRHKKIRIFLAGIISNFIVLLDILIILSFTFIFTKDISTSNFLIDFMLSNISILPFIVIGRYLLIYYEKVNIAKLRLEVEESLREQLINDIFDKGNFSSSDAFFYINTIAGQVSSFYSTLAIFTGSVLQVLAYLLYLVFTDTRAIIFILAGVAILYMPTLYIVKLGRKLSHRTYKSSQEISSDIEKIVDNLYLIKILKLTFDELYSFKNNLQEYYLSTLNNIKLGTLNAILPNFLTFLALSVLVSFFNIMTFITLDFIGIVFRLFQAIGVVTSNLHLVSAYHVYLEKLFLIQENKQVINNKNYNIEKLGSGDTAILFDNVSFKYFGSEEEIFDNLNLEIKKNKHTIVTGPNGCGKSTLMGLAAGVLYSSKGSIKLDTDRFGYVGAKPMIINSSLRENLNYGSKSVKEDSDLIELIQMFEVFTEKKDKVLDLKVSNKSLSTGQMQKISFIRALLGKPEILFLDESLSNVDLKTKNSILKVIENLEMTILNITHNIQDFQSFDYHLQFEIVNGKRLIKTF